MPIDRFSYDHPLGLCNHKGGEKLNSSGCEQLINNISPPNTSDQFKVYGCETCEYYLQQACVDLQNEIQNHPYHPNHNLTLLTRIPNVDGGMFECHACNKSFCSGSLYRCHECDFNLEIQCAVSLKPVVDAPLVHEHSLAFLEKRGYPIKCDCCENYSFGPFFRCVQCRFNLKYDCFPLGRIVKLKCHRHPITLSDPLTTEEDQYGIGGDDDDDDCEEYICDACEKDLDPMQPIYSCTQCEFISHLICGVTETQGECIIEEYRPLAEKLRYSNCNIEVDSETYTEIEEIKPALTLVVFSDSNLEEDYKEELKSVLRALTNEKVEFKDIFLNVQNEDSSNNFETSLFQTMAFTKFMNMFENYTQRASIDYKSVEITSEIVKVGNFMIPENLAPTLEALFAKYGDISEESTLSPKAKMCVVNNFCVAIYSMQNTKFVQLSESGLFSWWLSFKYAQHAGFKVQFIADQLKRLMRAKMTVRVKAVSEYIVEQIDKRNAEIQLKLEKLEKGKEKQVATLGSKFSEFCSREVSELETEYAGTNLL